MTHEICEVHCTIGDESLLLTREVLMLWHINLKSTICSSESLASCCNMLASIPCQHLCGFVMSSTSCLRTLLICKEQS